MGRSHSEPAVVHDCGSVFFECPSLSILRSQWHHVDRANDPWDMSQLAVNREPKSEPPALPPAGWTHTHSHTYTPHTLLSTFGTVIHPQPSSLRSQMAGYAAVAFIVNITQAALIERTAAAQPCITALPQSLDRPTRTHDLSSD